MTAIAVVTTVGSREEAQRLARTLVERRLAACAQISEIESIYRWKDAVQQEPEFRLLLKTTDERYAEVERAINEIRHADAEAAREGVEHLYRRAGAYRGGHRHDAGDPVERVESLDLA